MEPSAPLRPLSEAAHLPRRHPCLGYRRLLATVAHAGRSRNAAQVQLSSGTLTFCFTDIEGSTRLLRALGRDGYRELLDQHRRLLRTVWDAYGGREVDTEGDAFLVVFSQASDAVRAAAEAQRSLAAAPWPQLVELRVRIGLHTGEATEQEGKYVGLAVHRGARVASAAHGGQVLVSQAAREVAAEEDLEGLGFLDLGEHRLRDLTQPEHLYQLTGERLAKDFPPPRTLDSRRTNLPVQPTPFLGRARELGELEQLVRRGDVRLVTLTGPGGTGKTRLALQVAAELADEFPDGVHACFLAPVSDPTLVPGTIAQALGLRDRPGQTPIETLADYLSGRRLLLVVDSLEHLLECAGELSQLLRQAPRLTLIATSRAPLRLAGEQEYAVPPLAAEEASALFTARARMVRADFEVEGNTDAIASICRRLDDLPLAIELAAARTRSLSLRTLLARLESSLSVLTSGGRDADERQRTLRATIEWSYRLLTMDEQIVFRRLSVFRGAWSFAAAEAVCDPDSELDIQVLDVVDSLVEKSLVRRGQDLAGEARFYLLETIREYSAERLEEAGETDAARQRHANWFLVTARSLSADEQRGYEQLRAESENFSAALTASIDASRAELALSLIDSLSEFWDAAGRIEEGRRWSQSALRIATAELQGERAKALAASASFACRQGAYDDAASEIAEARALADGAGDRVALSTVENVAGVLAWSRGDLPEAATIFRRSLRLSHELGEKESEGVDWANLGKVLVEMGNWQEAQDVLVEGAARTAAFGLERAHAWCLSNLALLAIEQGDSGRARDFLGQALEIHSRVPNAFELLQSIHVAARLESLAGAPNRAARLWGAEEALRDEFELPLTPMESLHRQKHVETAREAANKKDFAAAWEEGRAMTMKSALRAALDATSPDAHERAAQRNVARRPSSGPLHPHG